MLRKGSAHFREAFYCEQQLSKTDELYECLCICVLRIHRSSSVHSKLNLRTWALPQHKTTACRRELEPRCECAGSIYRQQRSVSTCFYVSVLCSSAMRSPLWHPWHLLWNASGGSTSIAAAGQGAPGRAQATRPGNLKIQKIIICKITGKKWFYFVSIINFVLYWLR